MSNNADEIASKYLGKKTECFDEYNPDLLVAVPRVDNRLLYDINNNNNLPFFGWDVWHCYEFSSMTENGVPVTRVLKLRYECDSEFIVESKSLKLYLNSFNMSRFGRNINDCLETCKNLIEQDLSQKLNTKVIANFFEDDIEQVCIFDNFEDLMKYTNEIELKIENFKETPELLKTESNDIISEYYLKFNAMRSNCRVTHQPDFGDIYIYYKSKLHIVEKSLIKYLTSFRNEFHFHEECCEMIFKRLMDLLDSSDEVFVCALYTRRGGIDINPVRWSKNCSIKPARSLIDITKFARTGIKQ